MSEKFAKNKDLRRKKSTQEGDEKKVLYKDIQSQLSFRDYIKVRTPGIKGGDDYIQAGEIVEVNMNSDPVDIEIVNHDQEREVVMVFDDTEVVTYIKSEKSKKYLRSFAQLKQGDFVTMRSRDGRIVFGYVNVADQLSDKMVRLNNDVYGYYHGGTRYKALQEVYVDDWYEILEHVPAVEAKDYRDLGLTEAEYSKLNKKEVAEKLAEKLAKERGRK